MSCMISGVNVEVNMDVYGREYVSLTWSVWEFFA